MIIKRHPHTLRALHGPPPRIPEDTRRHHETYPPYHALMHNPRHDTCKHTPPHIRTSVLRTLQY
eukprot:2068298-Pyramimonas_sp.AAC.1